MVKAIPLWFIAFQSPKSGQICLNLILAKQGLKKQNKEFQSPKSGQICLNQELASFFEADSAYVSIPLIGSNLFKLQYLQSRKDEDLTACFNPLDRVKFV